MNNQAVCLNINAEELALANPESVSAMHEAIMKVLNEIDQARVLSTSSEQNFENMSVLDLVQRLHALVG